MNLSTLGIGYVAIGTAVAIAAAAVRRCRTASDAVLLVGLWPLWAPLAFARPTTDHRERELLAALARAQASPLAQVLPDAESARVLAARLREASVRLVELDEVLARPDFDPALAAAATAQLRVRTLGQLRQLRERYRSELDEVDELIAQLVAQAELVRLQPSIAHTSGELVRELVTRLEGLDDLFAYQAKIDGGLAEYPAAEEHSS